MASDLAELMNTIDTEEHRLQAHYQTYLRTITQNEPFVSIPMKISSDLYSIDRCFLGSGISGSPTFLFFI